MINNTNSLVLCRDDYGSETELFEAVKDAVRLLINAGYILTIQYDDKKEFGIIVIEYDYADRSLGGAYPYWLTSEKAEEISL